MEKKLKIYTRTGDKGQTSLFGGKRVWKSDSRVNTYGTVDEFNSMIGICIANIQEGLIKAELYRIQDDLLLIGSALANPQNPELSDLSERVITFEHLIDELTDQLPPLRNFILPGGGNAGALLHYARTLCRRVEREVVGLSQDEAIDDSIRMYVNRLSDLLFTMARSINTSEKQPETIWIKR